MLYNIKMKLLIGGKSRNIYMRKDGSAYYKSGGQQVDVTYMFKKKGGGLKKKYIKGGMNKAKFTELKEKCNTLRDKLKELHGKLAPHTFTDSGDPTTHTFITNDIIKDNFNGGQLLTKLADEINDASSSYIDGGEPEYDALMKLLKQAEVSKGIESLLSAGGDGTIQKDLEDIAVATAANFNTKQTALLARLNFFENVITEIGQIGETTGEDGEANTVANTVDIRTTLSVDVLSNFPAGIDGFKRAFFTLAHLVISVINKINANKEEGLTITSTDKKEIVTLVRKLNALINLFSQSHRGTIRGTNDGVFYNTPKFIDNVIDKAATKLKTQYLQIVRAGESQPNTYFIQGQEDITNGIICSIFTTFSSICKADEKPNKWEAGDPISQQVIAANINAFLKNDKVLLENIKIPKIP